MLELDERRLERKLKKEVEAIGGWALKFVSPGKSGVPDRLILLPGGTCFFVEVKAPDEKPRPLQKKRIREITNLGTKVYVIDTNESLNRLLENVRRLNE